MTAPPALVLASASPRRSELLARLGIRFSVVPSAIPEDLRPGETPEEHVLRLSREKAREVAGRPDVPGRWFLGSDTIVLRDAAILGKPADAAEAAAMLASLSGRSHRVLSGYAVLDRQSGAIVAGAVTTTVRFKELTAQEIAGYIATGEPFDKAGAYAIQGIGAFLVLAIEGSYSNVVGLPLCEVVEVLERLGAIKLFSDAPSVGAPLVGAQVGAQVGAKIGANRQGQTRDLPQHPMSTTIQENLEQIRNRIAAACRRAGRDPGAVRLVAVAKTVPAAAVEEAARAGQRIFGENYVQEFVAKADALTLPVEWHFIGALQTNKVKYLRDRVALIHSVDRLSLAEEIDRQWGRAGRSAEILLQVNLGGEATKSGTDEAGLIELATRAARLPHLRIRGLMALPPWEDDPEAVRPHFRRLRELAESVAALGLPRTTMAELSMGMSHDFEVAIEEGATLVRVGTALFGERTVER